MTSPPVSTEGLLIAGDRVEASTGATTSVINPATGTGIATVASATSEDITASVDVAHAAMADAQWAGMAPRERGALLGRIADLITERAEEIASVESANTGKPLGAARGEVSAAAATFRFYAGAADKFHGETIPTGAGGTLMTFREPVGVVGLIVPWNFPLLILSWKVAPALALGNTVVAKPAGVTPLSALALGDLALEAGVPPGVLNIVPGSGSVAGAALVADPRVRKLSFTGSTEVGASVMAAASNDIKRVSLELGGKSASIVFGDADIADAVDSSIWAVYDNAGQDCCARSRILVEQQVFDDFVDRFATRARNIVVGDPTDPDTEMGPLITRDHRTSVETHLERARSDGATLLCGGQRSGGELVAGSYLSPAVVLDVESTMPIMQEEVFGPVVAIVPFNDEAHAVGMANDSPYGLSGSIWTRDIGRAFRVARAFETGMISVNSSSSVHIEAPFGGVKKSGIGREQGMAALDHYSEYKTVFVSDS